MSLSLDRRRVAKNTVSQLVAYGTAMATGAVASIAVARTLGPHGLGVFSPAWMTVNIVSVVAMLGLDQRLVRVVNHAGAHDALDRSIAPAAALGLGFGALVALAPLAARAPGEIVRAWLAAGACIAVSVPLLMVRSSFQARERMELETIVLAVDGAAGIAATLATVALGGRVAAVILALAAGRAASLVVAVALHHRVWGPLRPTLEAAAWPSMIAEGLPMGAAFLLSTVAVRFDVVLAGVLLPAHRAGIYSAAAVVVQSVPVLATALNRSLYPVLSRASGPADPELHRVLDPAWRGILVLGVGAASLLAVLASGVVAVAFGAGFAESAVVLVVLAWVLPLRFVNNLLGTLLNATGRGNRRARWVAGAAVVNLLGCLALIPRYGTWGAAAASLATEAGLSALLVWALHPLPVRVASPLAHAAVASALGVLAVRALPGGLVPRALAGVAAFCAGAAGLEAAGRGAARRPAAADGPPR